MNQEELHLMIKSGILDGGQDYVHHFLIDIFLNVQIQSVNDHSNFEGITFDANNEQINELLMINLIFLRRNE